MNPLLTALRQAHAALDAATVRDEAGAVSGWVAADDLSSAELAEAVRLQSGLEARMAGLRLHVVAAAEAADAKALTGATDTDTWAARAAGSNRPRTWGSLGVAQRLESTYLHVRAALTQGRITEDHARIIVRSCEKVTDTLDRLRMDARVRGLSEEQVAAAIPTITAQEMAACEELLVAKALILPPSKLARAARRVLKPLRKRVEVRLPDVDPDTGELTEVDLADVVADDQLHELERRIDQEAYLTMHEDAEGWWEGRFRLPPLAGQSLRAQVEHRTAPRRARARREKPQAWHPRGVAVDPPPDDGTHLPTNHGNRLGLAFCEILEHLPPTAPAPGSGSTASPSWSTSTNSPCAPASAPPPWTPARRSPPPRPAASPATPASCPWSSPATRCPSTSAASNGSSPATRPSHCPPPTTPALPKAATVPSPGASCTTYAPGANRVPPTWPTPSPCAATTTAASTTRSTTTTCTPTAPSPTNTAGPAESHPATNATPSTHADAHDHARPELSRRRRGWRCNRRPRRTPPRWRTSSRRWRGRRTSGRGRRVCRPA